MADNTGTMTDYISSTQSGANQILNNLTNSIANLTTGGGAYRDKGTSFPSGTAADQKYGLFKNWNDLSPGKTNGQAAINKWQAYGNNAGLREAQLYGLYQASRHTLPSYFSATRCKLT